MWIQIWDLEYLLISGIAYLELFCRCDFLDWNVELVFDFTKSDYLKFGRILSLGRWIGAAKKNVLYGATSNASKFESESCWEETEI